MNKLFVKMPLIETQQQEQRPQINDATNARASRVVSFAPNTFDDEGEEDYSAAAGVGNNTISSSNVNNNTEDILAESPESVNSEMTNVNDGTGMKFVIPFQEYRLRFDQTYPDGLGLRIPASEFEIVLEQIHRELIKPLDKSQKTVRKWSAIVAGTAPIGVGFVLSIALARYVHRHQKAVKMFWISLRNFLKTINRDTYYSRGIEWRIERDLGKIEERDCFNKLYMFKIEIFFRKPITLRSGREVALRSIVDSKRPLSTRVSTSFSGQSRFSNAHEGDAELFALLSTAPGSERSYSFSSQTPLEDYEEAEDEELPNFATTDDSERLDRASLLMTVPETDEVAEARAVCTYEPPSPEPEQSVFSSEEAIKAAGAMTFADLLRANNLEDIKEEDEGAVQEEEEANIKERKRSAIFVADDTDDTTHDTTHNTTHDTTHDTDTITPPESQEPTTPVLNPSPPEDAFTQRQKKKFSRAATLTTQLYAIPESPTLLNVDEDPTKDALTYLTANDSEEEDVIEDIIAGRPSILSARNASIMSGASMLVGGSPVIKPVLAHFDDIGPTPVSAYPLADPFSPLYETDEVAPLNPSPVNNTSSSNEYTEVDGEGEFIRRKKWRVAPESAAKLSRVQTMGESIQPASRRSSYLPKSTRSFADGLGSESGGEKTLESPKHDSI